MSKLKTLGLVSLLSAVAFLTSPKYVEASGECVPVYGGGQVCPTPTPIPELPSAGVESVLLPGLTALLSGGIYISRKSKKFGKSK